VLHVSGWTAEAQPLVFERDERLFKNMQARGLKNESLQYVKQKKKTAYFEPKGQYLCVRAYTDNFIHLGNARPLWY
jgi:hypothetical protein